MQIKKIFLDANIFNDIFDENRRNHISSRDSLHYALEHDIQIFTSCDIVTNIYYITSKYVSKKRALNALETVKEIVHILPFAYDELSRTITLMKDDSDYKDMEDTIQYILALQENCDLIISNDKKFVSKKIKVVCSDEFIEMSQ